MAALRGARTHLRCRCGHARRPRRDGHRCWHQAAGGHRGRHHAGPPPSRGRHGHHRDGDRSRPRPGHRGLAHRRDQHGRVPGAVACCSGSAAARPAGGHRAGTCQPGWGGRARWHRAAGHLAARLPGHQPGQLARAGRAAVGHHAGRAPCRSRSGCTGCCRGAGRCAEQAVRRAAAPPPRAPLPVRRTVPAAGRAGARPPAAGQAVPGRPRVRPRMTPVPVGRWGLRGRSGPVSGWGPARPPGRARPGPVRPGPGRPRSAAPRLRQQRPAPCGCRSALPPGRPVPS
jgi:hypothetical protein